MSRHLRVLGSNLFFMIAIVDYGAGNLRSVSRALAAVGAEARVTSDPRDLPDSELVLLPGVGAAGDAMRQLAERGLVEPLRESVRSGQPFLGVCLGLQLLFSYSEEDEGTPCLNLIPGTVRRFPEGLKVPHMGWNEVVRASSGLYESAKLFDNIPEGSHFYFVHSYYGDPEEPSVIAATTEYGLPFASVLHRDNLIATQFHPEKSAALGLRLYANVLRYFRVPTHQSRFVVP
jgi:glutamine amidotransferase